MVIKYLPHPDHEREPRRPPVPIYELPRSPILVAMALSALSGVVVGVVLTATLAWVFARAL